MKAIEAIERIETTNSELALFSQREARKFDKNHGLNFPDTNTYSFHILSLSTILAVFTVMLSPSPSSASKLEASKLEARKLESSKQRQLGKTELPKREKTTTVWKLYQKGDFMGDRELYVSKDGYMAVYTKAKYTITSRTPEWKITFYNTTRKTIYSTTIAQSKKNFGLRSRFAKESFFPAKYHLEDGPKQTIAGQKCSSIFCVADKNIGKTQQKTDVERSAFYISDEIPMAPQMTDYFGQTWTPELCKRQSLRIVTWDYAGRQKTKIETVKIEKLELPVSVFDPPPGLQAVKSEDQVMLGNDLINDIVDDLGKGFGNK
ncbi:MAG: hypothetical protein J0M35_12145 [Candidatus Obscuribacter phosphatis]|uniref:DUF4412 domain-containing protein n=1 Tax=Candidatus Obscuribacter phosphatis TaxID=1906157 RepID=A0A8J7P7U0_9BACT|nr:hypothetical protein [Candidatus Obscuribacter phosphatis]